MRSVSIILFPVSNRTKPLATGAMEIAMRHILQTLLAVLAAFLLVTAGLAQQPTAQITAIISDASGAVVPGALIKVVNLATGLHWEAQSNESGNYTFSNLSPGDYQIAVSREGFTTVNRTGINLVISQVARLDF